jgi:hypothetical protein
LQGGRDGRPKKDVARKKGGRGKREGNLKEK